jgi:hypothetical protein
MMISPFCQKISKIHGQESFSCVVLIGVVVTFGSFWGEDLAIIRILRSIKYDSSSTILLKWKLLLSRRAVQTIRNHILNAGLRANIRSRRSQSRLPGTSTGT